MPDFSIKFPFAWQAYLGLFAILLLIGLIKWRRHLLGIVSVVSLIAAVVILISLSATWRTLVRIAIHGTIVHHNKPVNLWEFAVLSEHGGYVWSLDKTVWSSKNHYWGDPYEPTSLYIGHGPNLTKRYPYFEADYSILHHSPLLNQSLRKAGFSAAWWHHPADPNHDTLVARYGIAVPQWVALLLCLPFPLLWFRRSRRHRYRLHHNLCLKCGYDMRGSTDKCPECGTPIMTPNRPELTETTTHSTDQSSA